MQETIKFPIFRSITGPAIYHFQQVDALYPKSWIYVVTLIGLVEAFTIVKVSYLMQIDNVDISLHRAGKLPDKLKESV